MPPCSMNSSPFFDTANFSSGTNSLLTRHAIRDEETKKSSDGVPEHSPFACLPWKPYMYKRIICSECPAFFFFSYPNFLCQTELANYFLTNKLFKNQVFSTSYVLVGSVTPVCSNSLFDRKTCVQVRLATTWLWQFKGIWNISKTPSPEGSNCGF